jgi:hypothetical protein
MPKPNVGEFDRIIRVLLGFGIVLFGLINDTWWAVAGLYFIASGMMEHDVIYNLLGISTAPKARSTTSKPKVVKKPIKRKK